MSKTGKEVNRILQQQRDKGLKQWEIVCSLTYAGKTERSIGQLLNCDPRTVHSMKMRPVKREIKNYLRLDVVSKQKFFKLLKELEG